MKYRSDKNVRRVSSILAAVGLAAPFYARFAGEGAGAAGDGDGTTGVLDSPEPKPEPKPPAGGVVDPAEHARLKKEKEEAIAESIRRKDELKKKDAELEKLRQGQLSPEELEEFRAAKAEKARLEEENLKKRGEFERLAKEREDKHKAEMDKLQRERDEMAARWEQDKVTGELGMLLPLHTSVPASEVMPLIQRHVKWDREEARFVIDVNGTAPLRPDGKEMSVAEFVEDWVSKRDWLARHKPAGGSGSSASAGRAGKAGAISPEDLSKMSQADYNKNHKTILAEADKNTPRRTAGAA